MSTSKITNYFGKIPPPRSGMVEMTSHITVSSNSGQFSKISGSDHIEGTSLPEADLSTKPQNLGKQPIVIDLETQEENSDEEETCVIKGNNLNDRKICQIYESSDSEADIEDLTLLSPLKPKRRVIVDYKDSDDSASEDVPETSDLEITTVHIGGHSDSASVAHTSQKQESSEKEHSAQLNSSKKIRHSDSSSDEELSDGRRTRKKRLRSRNQIKDDDSPVQIEIFSDSSQKSIVKTLPLGHQGKTHNSNNGNSDGDSDEDWDVDKSAILEERTRTRKQSHYREMLARMQTRKGKGREISHEGTPEGPMDRFTQRPSGYAAHGNSNWVQEESDDDSDDQDDFVVDDDIIDGEKTNKTTAPIQLPAEFSTRYQDDTEGHFRTYFEYLMRRSQDPSLRDVHSLDTRFQVAINSVQRLMETCKDKIYTPVWKPEFVKDLSYWPSMSFKALREYDHDCDACQISGKGSTCSITFFGSGYDENYMPNGERARSSANMEEIEVVNKMWLSYANDRPHKDQYWVGSTCFYRARVYHGLVHLPHDLSVEIRAFVNSVLDALNNEDIAIAISDQKLAYVIERMNDTGFSDKLWSMARQRVNDALHFRTDRLPLDGLAFLRA